MQENGKMERDREKESVLVTVCCGLNASFRTVTHSRTSAHTQRPVFSTPWTPPDFSVSGFISKCLQAGGREGREREMKTLSTTSIPDSALLLHTDSIHL